jgi:hypothetical protein
MNEIKTNKNKEMLIRMSEEEWNMVQTLKANPYYINMSQYIRDCIHHLHNAKTNKAGRPK